MAILQRVQLVQLLRNIGFCAVIAFVLSGGHALAALSSQSLEYLEEAKQSLESGDVAAAIIQLKNAIREDADNSEARFTLALIPFSF